MEASFLDFRKRSREIIRALDRNETVTVTYRGKPRAIMQPIAANGSKKKAKKKPRMEDQPMFGMWKDREDMKDVAAYVRRLRKGRFDAL